MESFIGIIDNALKALVYNKFKTVMDLGNDQNVAVIQEKSSIALRKRAEKKGAISTEFISIWREDFGKDWARQNTPVARHGFYLDYSDADKKDLITVKAFPVYLNYSIRFWTRNLDKATSASELFLGWYQVSPKLIFNYMDKYPLEFNLKSMDAIVDESTFDEQYDKGLYIVNKGTFTIDGWVLISFTTGTILTINLKIYAREVIDGVLQDTLLDTFTITADNPRGR